MANNMLPKTEIDKKHGICVQNTEWTQFKQ